MARLAGVDVGGTFTDLIVVDDDRGQVVTAKVPTSLPDQSVAILSGLEEIDENALDTDLVVHGSTVATNAVIERKGARVGLITTPGMRDVIELGRRDRPDVYGFFNAFRPLIPRELRLEVDERVAFDGEVETPLDEAAVTAAGKQLIAAGAEAVVVCFLHSYAFPAHEERAVEILKGLWPNPSLVTGSAQRAPEVGEFERFATAAANTYLQPVMERYVQRLVGRMREREYEAPLLIVQSNGGLMTAEEVLEYPIATVKSGPAAGVVAGAMAARLSGKDHVITCDMGGTSFDVCLVAGGDPPVTTDWGLDFRLPVRAPAVDLVAIGAGGGSLAEVDPGGVLMVGPRSAGADPGPACYGLGGQQATVTDANLVLGRLAAKQAMGTRGEIKLDMDAATAAIARVGEQIGKGVEEAAEAILDVAASNMANAIRTVSVERGHDPRDFAMVIFGGAGPLHVSALMRETGVDTGIVPPLPGIACAVGAIAADLRYERTTPTSSPLSEIGSDWLRQELTDHEEALREQLKATHLETENVIVTREADLQYLSQHHTLRVRLPDDPGPEEIKEAFETAYQLRYGYTLEGAQVTLVNLHSVIEASHGGIDHARLWRSRAKTPTGDRTEHSQREIVFEGERHQAGVHWRWSLQAGDTLSGPLVLEQEDSTVFIEPGFGITVDDTGSLIVQRISEGG